MTKWYIKEFSSMTGISMRSLRHYDEMGLITPSLRLKTGYRLYSSMDLARAQQVIALKSFGIELQDIKTVLDDNVDLSSYFNKQMILLKEKIQGFQKASHILEQLTAELNQKQSISISNIMKLIGIYNMSTTHFENYLKETFKLDPTQMDSLIKEYGPCIPNAPTVQEIEEIHKMHYVASDNDATSLELIKECPQEGSGDEDPMQSAQKMLVERLEKIKHDGFTKERMELLKLHMGDFNKKLALAMIHGHLASSLEVQEMIKELWALNPECLDSNKEDLIEHYKSLPKSRGMRIYFNSYTPGFIDFIAEAFLFFLDNQAAWSCRIKASPTWLEKARAYLY